MATRYLFTGAKCCFVDKDEAGMMEMELEFKHVPTLVVGLGGTGNEIARRLKAKFAARYPGEDTLIRYLVMDTDRKSFRDGFWDREEQVFLRLSLMPRHILTAFYSNEHAEWMPKDPKINPDHFVNQESGAGLIRPIGRLYFQDQVAQVRDRLEKAKNSLSDLAERMRTKTILGTGDFQVYIVGSLAGGTGCGAFLDVAALIRDLFEENCFITGLFTLYPCYAEALRGDVDQSRRSKANCYAALKELEFFMQEKDETQPHLYTVKFWDGTRVNLYKRLFNICYLVENSNDSGAKLGSLAQIYELCAQQLFHEIGSPLGEDYRSKINNLSFFQSGLAGEEWREWGRKRRFSSFGNVSLVFPKDKVLKYCSNRLTQEIIEEKLIGLHPTQGESNLLKSLGIGEWYERPPVLEDELVEYTELLLNYRLSECKPEEIDELIARRVEEVERSFPEQLRNMQFAGLKAKWVKSLAQEVSRCMYSGGTVTTRAMFKHLVESLDVAKHQWGRLLERCRQDHVGLGDELANLRSELRSLGFFARISRGKASAQQVFDIYNAWLDARLEKELVIRLLEVLTNFGEEIQKSRRHVENLHVELDNLLEQVRKNLKSISFYEDQKVDPTVLVQEVISEKDCLNFYLEHKPKEITALINNFWELESSELIEQVTNSCEECFQVALEELTLVKFLRQKYGDRGKDAWNELLDQLREICRPFWTARLKHGEYYNQTCLVGLAKEGGDFPPEVVTWARDRSDATRGIDCVNTYYPYAIDISVCSHGAFAGYLSGLKDYYFQYEQFLRNKEFPVHLHEQFRYLPELDPYRDMIGQFFALASAYSLIAENNEGYFFALNRGQVGWEFRYKTQAAIKPINWDELKGGTFTYIPRKTEPSFLGVTRSSAQSNLADNSTYVSFVNSFVQERINKNGRDKVRKELEEYTERMLREPGEGGQLMLKEAQALKIFLETQLNKEKIYG
jgi:hypothetical protein